MKVPKITTAHNQNYSKESSKTKRELDHQFIDRDGNNSEVNDGELLLNGIIWNFI